MEYKIVDKTPIKGFQRVMANNLYGIINQDGHIVCKTMYDNISLYCPVYSDIYIKHDRIPVCKNGKWGCIDKTGHLVINIQFDETFLIKERCFTESYNFSRVHFQGKECVIDRIGNIMTERFNPDFIQEIFGERFVFMDKYKGELYIGTLAYDLINEDLPPFWKLITGSQYFDYYKIFGIKYLQNSTYKISTLSKDYIINFKGEILQVKELSFIEKASRKTKDIVLRNFPHG